MRIPEDVADIFEKIKDLAENSLHGEIDLSEAMWEIEDLVTNLLQKEYNE